MRYDSEHKDRTRSKLLKAAAEQMRLHGPDGVSVANVMKRAGLTHGGFYAHFESKDALIAAAVAAMFDHAAERRARTFGVATSIDAFIDTYVSETHRDNPTRGCPVPCLMSESGRWPASARKAFDEGVMRLANRLAALLPPHIADQQSASMSLVAEMAGAIALSRAIGDPTLANELLAASREALKQRFVVASSKGQRNDH
jgi:TetR/AcrR family transcriptional repressor of nem operon